MENKSSNGLVFSKETDEKEFLRKTFLSLTNDKNAPDDILESEFSEPVSDTIQAVAIGTDVDLNYSVSIGYERFVEKKVYNKIRKEFETKKETVVNYQPLSSSFSHKCNGYAENSDNPREYLALPIATAYRTTNKENMVRPSGDTPEKDYPVVAKASAIAAAKEYAKLSAVDACKKSLPGDTFKDFSYNGKIEVTSQAELTIPSYSVDYNYKGENYTASSFASGDYKRWGKLPERKKKEEKEEKKNSFFSMFLATLKNSAEGNGGTSGDIVKLTTALTCATVFFGMLTVFLSMILGHTVGIVLFVLTSLAILGQTLALPVVIEYSYSKLLEKKLSALESQLEKHKLSPLSEEESKSVNDNLGSQKKENQSINTATLVISVFIYVIAAILSEMYILGVIVGLIIGGTKAFFRFKKNKKETK